MESVFVLLLAVISSLLLWVFGRYRLRLTFSGLARAVASMLECLGLAVALYAANLVVGVAVTALLRVATGRFVSLYHTADPVLLLLSLLQALVFCWWQQGSKGSR